MANRTRRRAVLRERREHAQEREDVRPQNIANDKFKRGRIRYDDLPDGPRVKGTFGEVVLSSGVITEQQLRSSIQREWREFKADLESRSSEWKKLIGN